MLISSRYMPIQLHLMRGDGPFDRTSSIGKRKHSRSIGLDRPSYTARSMGQICVLSPVTDESIGHRLSSVLPGGLHPLYMRAMYSRMYRGCDRSADTVNCIGEKTGLLRKPGVHGVGPHSIQDSPNMTMISSRFFCELNEELYYLIVGACIAFKFGFRPLPRRRRELSAFEIDHHSEISCRSS